ncbi:hypothetical protein ACXM0N_08920 [Peribacillus simplex]
MVSRDPTAACGEKAWQTVGGKGVDFGTQLERLKTAGKLAFLRIERI